MRLSIKTKAVICIVFFAVLLSLTALFVNNRIIGDVINKNYIEASNAIAKTVAVSVDPNLAESLRDAVVEIYNDYGEPATWDSPDFETYLAAYGSIEGRSDFQALHKQLESIQNCNDVTCIYLIYLDSMNQRFVYLVDADVEDPCAPGVVDPMFEENIGLLSDPTIGMPAYITDTDEYGWLVTAGAPIYDSEHKVICYACCDMSMNDIRKAENTIFLGTAGLFILIIIIISVIGIILVSKKIVEPINQLTKAASEFFADESMEPRHSFADLKFERQDELGLLANSMKQMEQDINDYFAELMVTTEVLSETEKQAQKLEREASRMSHMAMVDPLTRVRNKRAFENLMLELNEDAAEDRRDFGIVVIDINNLKTINDTYGHEKGDKALCTACHVICTVFKHSPVFRVGGDEFVAVLKYEDFKNAKNLQADLQDEFLRIQKNDTNDEESKPWEHISAAIGCALFDPASDRNAESVFQRAYDIMYAHKKELKSKNNL